MPKIDASSLAEHNDQAWRALTGALERLLASTPHEEITMARVAGAAGMARNTLYNYASDKPSLVAAITERASARLLAEVKEMAAGDGPPIERLECVTRAILAWFVADEHRLVVANGLFSNAPASKVEQASEPLLALERHVSGLVEEGIACGQLRCSPDTGLTLQLLSSIMQTAVHRIVARPADLSLVTQETLRIVRACLQPDP